MAYITVLAFSCLMVVLCILRFVTFRKSKWPLPPGPPGEPILGHIRIVPSEQPEYTYATWAKQYNSDVIYVNMLGKPVVVLNSARAAIDLLDKRGANYSDRPRFTLFEVKGWEATLTFLRWGSRFKMHRKFLQRAFSPSAVPAYRGLQQDEAYTLLRGLLEHPQKWEMALRRFATAVVLSAGFGVSIHSDDDPYIEIAENASYAISHGGAPGGTLVDAFPFVRHLPDWLARSSTLKFARDWKWAIRAVHDIPFAQAQKEFEQGCAKPSFVRALLHQQNGGAAIDKDVKAFTLADVKGAAGAVFVAGQDTTWATLIVFVLNMVLHPDIQRRAQHELDQVTGPDRLPTFEDRPKLRYIDHIVQETLRWAPVSPIGVPHRSLADDVYEGMFIPKGSVVYANARAMTHDERVYRDPDAFDPDRYVPESEGGAGEPFPVGQFGFGRRVCVGRHLAEASVWIVVAAMLATFDITKAVDEDGNEITPTVELTDGLTSHPKPFSCCIKPRSSRAVELIKRTA